MGKSSSGAVKPSSMNLLTTPSVVVDKSKSPKEARRIHKHKPPSSSSHTTPRLPPVTPSPIRHRTTSISEAMAREFFGQTKSGSGEQTPPFSKHHLSATGRHIPHRHSQNVTKSPLLRRQNPDRQTAGASVVSSLSVSMESLDPQTRTLTMPKTSRKNLQFPVLSEKVPRSVLPQAVTTAQPDLLSPHVRLKAPKTAGVVSPRLRRKLAQNQTDKKPVTGESCRRGDGPSTQSYFRVVVLGEEGVGKSTLVRQMAMKAAAGQVIGERRKGSTEEEEEEEEKEDAEEEEEEEEEEEKEEERVAVQIHGHDKRYTMEIFDNPLNANIDTLRPDAFVVMYSASDRKSYLTAQEVTRHLRCELGMYRTIFLVANKMDLRRQQHVPAKGD
ncbi:hypothetical protein ACOMHN_059079 [Nucella lapillus]